MNTNKIDPGKTYVLEETTITQSLSLQQLGLLAAPDDSFIEVDFEVALEQNTETPQKDDRPLDDEHCQITFVASKLCRALMRAHSALTLYEGLHAAHKEQLQWIGAVDGLPAPLGKSLDKLFLDLARRLQAAENRSTPLNSKEAQDFLDCIEQALDMALVAINANHRRSLT